MKPLEIVHKLIGNIKIDDDERAVLNLSPKFAVMKKLELIDMEQDSELGLAKLRYEIMRIMRRIKDEEEEETNYGIKKQRKRMRIEEREREEEEEILNDAKSRQIFDPMTRRFNYAKRRVTDLSENKSVVLPKGVDDKLESEMGILKELIIGEFKRYKRETEKKKKLKRLKRK